MSTCALGGWGLRRADAQAQRFAHNHAQPGAGVAHRRRSRCALLRRAAAARQRAARAVARRGWHAAEHASKSAVASAPAARTTRSGWPSKRMRTARASESAVSATQHAGGPAQRRNAVVGRRAACDSASDGPTRACDARMVHALPCGSFVGRGRHGEHLNAQRRPRKRRARRGRLLHGFAHAVRAAAGWERGGAVTRQRDVACRPYDVQRARKALGSELRTALQLCAARVLLWHAH